MSLMPDPKINPSRPTPKMTPEAFLSHVVEEAWSNFHDGDDFDSVNERYLARTGRNLQSGEFGSNARARGYLQATADELSANCADWDAFVKLAGWFQR